MDEKKVQEIIEKRRQEDKAFRLKYDAFMEKQKKEGKMPDNELDKVAGGFLYMTTCPKCGTYDSLITYTFGIYSSCEVCGYEEWGRGWI